MRVKKTKIIKKKKKKKKISRKTKKIGYRPRVRDNSKGKSNIQTIFNFIYLKQKRKKYK